MNLIELPDGDLFTSGAEALVNPVNTVGVSGKGLALEFKKRFPKAVEKYEAVCKLKAFDVGNVLVCTEEGESPKYVIHFPTKEHWKRPSRTLYIDSGLLALWRAIDHHKIRSIAIPALGCGLGGLKWENVRFLIVEYLKAVDDLTVYLYPPKEQS